MNSTWLWNLHQRHKPLKAEAFRDILKIRVSEMVFPGVFKRCFQPQMPYFFARIHETLATMPLKCPRHSKTRAVNPLRLQILRIDGEGMINDVIMHTAHDVIGEKKTCKKDVVGIVTLDLIGLLPIPEFVRKCSMLTVEQLKQCKVFETVEQQNSSNNEKHLKFHRQKIDFTRNGKLRQLSGRFQTLIWRPGDTVQNLESPELSGRVDSPARNRTVRTFHGSKPV